MTMKDVHTEHCCKWHGCKYSWGLEEKEEKCTVLQGAPQSFPCEECTWAWETYIDIEKEASDPEWIDFISGRISE